MRCTICHSKAGEKKFGHGIWYGSAGTVIDRKGREQILCDDCAWNIYNLTGIVLKLKGYDNRYKRYEMFVEGNNVQV